VDYVTDVDKDKQKNTTDASAKTAMQQYGRSKTAHHVSVYVFDEWHIFQFIFYWNLCRDAQENYKNFKIIKFYLWINGHLVRRTMKGYGNEFQFFYMEI